MDGLLGLVEDRRDLARRHPNVTKTTRDLRARTREGGATEARSHLSRGDPMGATNCLNDLFRGGMEVILWAAAIRTTAGATLRNTWAGRQILLLTVRRDLFAAPKRCEIGHFG